MQHHSQTTQRHIPGNFSHGPSRPGQQLAAHEQSLAHNHTDDNLDPDQKLSAELGLSFSPPPLLALSEPPLTSFMSSPSYPSPLPLDDIPDIDLASSPAALFLSVFSPSASECSLAPDDQGALVAGYILGPIVGHGGFSIIRTASSSQGGTVAVKIVRRSDLDSQPDPQLARKSLAREAHAWASLNHEHILPLFTVEHTLYADFFFTAYCPAGSLFDILKRDGHPALPQDDAGMMFRQVVRGLRYMHEGAGYVHGDLKLENVLVDEMGVCKIGDFGMARKIGESDDDAESDDEDGERDRKHEGPQRARTVSQAHAPAFRSVGRHKGKLPLHLSLRRPGGPSRHRTSSPFPDSSTSTLPNRGFAPGSLPYAAPELLLSPTSTTPYAANPAQDIWALGVMLYALLTGKLPFSDSFEPRLQMKILHGVFEMPQGVGRSAEQALRGCMERSVPNRWTVAMVDDVAWGIGWGSAADDVTPPPESTAPHSRSRSRGKARREHALDDDDDERRSASRPARSSSRSASISAVRTPSRSKSRPPHHHPYEPPPGFHHHPLLHTSTHPAHPLSTQPSLSSLTNAILRTTSAASSDSSGTHDSSALILQPTLAAAAATTAEEEERGRAPRTRLQAEASESLSRSRSPHEMPATPKDLPLDAVLHRHRKSPPCAPAPPALALAHDVPELETLDEDERWVLSPDAEEPRSSSRDRGRAFGRERTELRRAMRNESMPPAPGQAAAAWMAPASSKEQQGRLGYASAAGPATPVPIPGAATRSRSVDAGGGRESRRRPALVSSARHAK